jgi:hypothetical protein
LHDRDLQHAATDARPHPPAPGKPKPYPYYQYQSANYSSLIWMRRARGCADVLHGSAISEYECGRPQKAPVNPATGMPIG